MTLLLCILLLTPIGWIGMICLAASIGIVVDAKDHAKSRLVGQLKWKLENDSNEALREWINEL